MKKAILILSILALDVFAVDCIRATFNAYVMQYTIYSEDYEGLRTDSMYVNKGSSIYASKDYWTGNHLDSVIEYGKSSDSEEWKNRVTLMNRTATVTQEGDLKKYTILDDGEIDSEYFIFLDKDSLYYKEGIEDDTIYIKNDTLHRDHGEEIIVKDADNENKCYDKDRDNNVWMTYEYETRGDTLIQKRTHQDGGKVLITFMVPVDSNSTTTIQRKVRPAIYYKKAKHFDLLGRPAQGKYTIEFLK